MTSTNPEAEPKEEPEGAVCMDCLWHRPEPELSTVHPGYCVHFTPEFWEARGYRSHWGDAAVSNWPHLEILRYGPSGRYGEERKRTHFVILAPHATRRPVILECDGFAWGSY